MTGRPSIAPGREEEAHVLVSQGAGSGGDRCSGGRCGGGSVAEAGTVKVGMTVNGKAASADVDPRTLLVQFLRENLRLTGTHVGCDTSQCGACVVHLDGRAVKSCTVLAASCDGASVTTIEGLAKDGKLHPMQEAFRQHHGLQCGFCTPGMIMAAVDLATRKGGNLDEQPSARAWRATCAVARAITTSSRPSGPAPPPWAACARPPNSFATFRAERLNTNDRGATPWPTPASGRPSSAGKTSGSSRARGSTPTTSTVPGQVWAVFVRSPHAHANIKKIDAAAALKSPGCLAVYTGEDIAKDKVGNLICGWMIHSKDGSPMKAGAHPALAQGKVRYVGDHVAVVIAETLAQAKDAAEAVSVDYEPLPAAADVATAQNPGQPQIHAEAPNNTVYQWHLGDKAKVDAAFAGANHVTKIELDQQPADPQRHRAAGGDRRVRLAGRRASRSIPPARTRTSRAWCWRLSSAWRPSTSCA